MGLRGPQKAAMLLMHLDPQNAAELLGSTKPETITEIATELAYLAQSDKSKETNIDAIPPELLGILAGHKQKLSGEAFIEETLEILLGSDKSRDVLRDVSERVRVRDPFKNLRAAEVSQIAVSLDGEPPQVISVVLSELPHKKSVELLGMLDDEKRVATIQCMAVGGEVSPEAKLQVATIVQSRMEEHLAKGGGTVVRADVARKLQLRRVAVLLRSMPVEARENLIKPLAEKDKEIAETIGGLMVVWEDIPLITARALQESLRSAESRKLALALVDADEKTAAKIRDNISERAQGMLDEETSLLSSPKQEDIQGAREDILASLRELSSRGELEFEEE